MKTLVSSVDRYLGLKTVEGSYIIDKHSEENTEPCGTPLYGYWNRVKNMQTIKHNLLWQKNLLSTLN